MHYKYKFKFYVSARHSSEITGTYISLHPHTWELSLNIFSSKNELIKFNYLENKVNEYLKNFEEQSLNKLEAFKDTSCTTEDIANIFFKDLSLIFSKDFIVLDSLELSENPTRTYIVYK